MSLFLRLIWYFTPGYAGDFDSFENWAVKMVDHGTTAAYSFQDINYDCDYPPVYLYVLAFFGHLFSLFDLPIDSLLFDNTLRTLNLLIEYCFIYFIHRRFKDNFLTCLLLLNPATIINAYAWGQVDIIYTVILFMVFFSIHEKKLIKAALFLATGLAFKTQTILFLPLIGLYFLFSDNTIKNKITSFIVCVLLFVIWNLPFIAWANNPLSSIDVHISAIGRYAYMSLFAFNTWWAIFADPLQQFPPGDVIVFGSITRKSLSLLISGILLFIAIIPLFKKISFGKLLFVICFFTFTYFMFLPEMHERYLFPYFIFSVFVVMRDQVEWKYYILLSIVHSFNLFWSWIFIWKLSDFYMFEISVILSYLSIIIWIFYFINTYKKLTANSY